MTVLSDYIARMVDAGMDPEEATQIVAEIFAAGVANVASKSTNAERQKRYRERKKTVTNRNETVTERNAPTVTETVTKRNETVTTLHPPLSKSNSSKEKKGEGRATQMPDGWRPDPDRWAAAVETLGSADRAERELRKFTNNAAATGKVFKKWNAAWNNWVDRALEWSPVAKTQPAVGVIDPATVDWDAVCKTYVKFRVWSKHAPGNSPDSDSCLCPPEILAKYGIEKFQPENDPPAPMLKAM